MTASLKIGLAQISSVWLKRDDTVDKVADWVKNAAAEGCRIVAFGESLIPGYPFWIEHTNGAAFNNDFQKEMFAHYINEAVCIEQGHLDPIRKVAASTGTVVIVGCYERAIDRGGHSGYCSCVTIDDGGEIINIHRKAMPTYEERLVWGIGDGHGLQVFGLSDFTIGALNCWENWMPLMRAALQGQGEDLHFAIWPGSLHNTKDITRFAAIEGRSFVASVSGVLRYTDIPNDIPNSEILKEKCPAQMSDGGTCVAAPDGCWVVEPIGSKEQLVTTSLDYSFVQRERHNFDAAGHYSRPDITQLRIDRRRQGIVRFRD